MGSRITVRTVQGVQHREVKAGSSYASLNDFRAHFGLGKEDQVQELTVRWPSGRVSVLKELQANQILHLREP